MSAFFCDDVAYYRGLSSKLGRRFFSMGAVSAAALALAACSPAQQQSFVKTAKRFAQSATDAIVGFPLVPASVKAEVQRLSAKVQAVPDTAVLAVLAIDLETFLAIAEVAAPFIPGGIGAALRTVLAFLRGLLTPAAGTAFAAGPTLAEAEAAAKVLAGAK